MKEDFVSYDIAVKLKEKGFDWLPLKYYHCGEKDCLSDVGKNGGNPNKNKWINHVSCPTIYQSLKWLREEKHLFVDISLCASGYYGYIYSTIFPKDKDFSDGWMFEGKYDTYESAALAGIWHVLENLI